MRPEPMAANRHTPETRVSLILRIRNPDDMLAWQEFVEIYEPLIRSLAIRRGLQRADSDDVTQEVLTRIAKHIESWDAHSEHSSFRAWLATITKNQTIQYFGHGHQRTELRPPLDRWDSKRFG